MHAQCPKEQVLRLPCSNREELSVRENVEDRQVQLNEDWSSYATKNSLPQSALRVKNATESWTDFESRKKMQEYFFELHEQKVENEKLRNEKVTQSSQAQSSAVIDKLLAYDRDRLSKQTPQQHALLVDFCKYQQQLFSMQIAVLEEFERVVREKLHEGENELLYSIVTSWHAVSELQQVRLRERIEEEHRKQQLRELMEQQKAEEEMQREVERIAREKQKAEDEKERAETAKRLERKRREDERRAKARLEREQRMNHDSASERNS
ncbi:hypothetical protein ABB37_05811 [Leptomonas pyrrhocoris]|uniref:Uncharacterized protein n=1 Tax=Leptomonas pyrrhocoris TaxID=157538 RepID=A0A0N0VEU9_LEPPY|nr:hypothetical protein ABB37_05811 [Leptomonas pyrrhocoris]KPA79371.1 hypothetical protein ABB37_05811 [Leptomonas pyrrhocoris]|eukprot:XP_015657810.1 hypothetical protein ABB37_05811 [Leptomonas pyrrhocoris]